MPSCAGASLPALDVVLTPARGLRSRRLEGRPLRIQRSGGASGTDPDRAAPADRGREGHAKSSGVDTRVALGDQCQLQYVAFCGQLDHRRYGHPRGTPGHAVCAESSWITLRVDLGGRGRDTARRSPLEGQRLLVFERSQHFRSHPTATATSAPGDLIQDPTKAGRPNSLTAPALDTPNPVDHQGRRDKWAFQCDIGELGHSGSNSPGSRSCPRTPPE